MAETILVELAKLLLGQLSSGIVQEVNLVLGVEDELGRIKSNLSSIQAVLKDAEKQQSTSESVKNWLGKLEDVMYDIDDLLDGITTDVKIQEKNKGDRRRRVRKFFSRTNSLKLRWQWAHQIKSLCKKLDVIADERAYFVFSTESVDLDSSDFSRRETNSRLNKSDLILGRDEDKEAVISSILDCGDCESLSVVPILGQGGMGKTTLAKLLYNDSRIDENFDKKLWVYVSDKFNMRKILKKVISMAAGESKLQETLEQPSLEELGMKVGDAFKDKKYFLILDDFWNEDSNEWRKLRELLDVGAKGSTVVVTTRDSKVATNAQTVKDAYRLKELSQETCLDLFKRLAFRDGCKRIDPKVLDLANRIVEMSRGLPFLVTALANLLCGETNEAEWRHVIYKLEQGHEDILNILKLSYDQLPSYIKLCFRVSSIYGKGAQMNLLGELVPLWMALGFIPSDDQGEEITGQCVSKLLSKSLFMQEEHEIYQDKMLRSFHMHEFVYDLSTSMLGEELAIINSSTKKVPEKVRYIKLGEEALRVKQIPKRLAIQAKKARLLMIVAPEHPLSKVFLKTIFSRLIFLRVLNLKGCQFEELPSIIGYMAHLRYLDLEDNVRLKQLPSSICNLINLQSLSLEGCTNLQKLPTDIGRLENLRLLVVTTKQEVLPEGIGNIKGLRVLTLSDCPRLAFLPMSITQLANLSVLILLNCKELDLAHGSWSLQGLNNLRILVIFDLPKFKKLPTGSQGLPFTSLQHLVISGCDGLRGLGEWIMHFTSLKTLSIGGCPNLRGFPLMFRRLEKLEMLTIIDCRILSERCKPREGTSGDWNLISNIPYIDIDGDITTSTKDDIQSS